MQVRERVLVLAVEGAVCEVEGFVQPDVREADFLDELHAEGQRVLVVRVFGGFGFPVVQVYGVRADAGDGDLGVGAETHEKLADGVLAVFLELARVEHHAVVVEVDRFHELAAAVAGSRVRPL